MMKLAAVLLLISASTANAGVTCSRGGADMSADSMVISAVSDFCQISNGSQIEVNLTLEAECWSDDGVHRPVEMVLIGSSGYVVFSVSGSDEKSEHDCPRD